MEFNQTRGIIKFEEMDFSALDRITQFLCINQKPVFINGKSDNTIEIFLLLFLFIDEFLNFSLREFINIILLDMIHANLGGILFWILISEGDQSLSVLFIYYLTKFLFFCFIETRSSQCATCEEQIRWSTSLIYRQWPMKKRSL